MIAAVADEPGVVINNIGPIEHLELAAKPGTITVLRGNNGRGKSTALDVLPADSVCRSKSGAAVQIVVQVT